MYQRRNLSEELKHQLKNGTMTNRIVIANVVVFLFIHTFLAIGRMSDQDLFPLIDVIFTLNTSWKEFLMMPWGVFTSIFTHFDLYHIFFNMIFLYFAGNMFERFFSGKKLLLVYIFGGLLGGVSEILNTTVFSSVYEAHHVIGASGSVMAIFTALAFYSPNTKVHLFGILPVRLFLLALFFLATDLIGIGKEGDNIAHFAHLGGAFFGFLAVQNINTSKNVIFQIERLQEKIKNLFKKKPKMYYTRSDQHKTDEQYNFDKRKKQERTDIILDKISKSGYDSLTKEEKDFLLIKVKMDSSEKLKSYSLGVVIGMNILFSFHLLLSYTAPYVNPEEIAIIPFLV